MKMEDLQSKGMLDKSHEMIVARTKGMRKDGVIEHGYDGEWHLVPLGNWNWKWNASRLNYSTFEKELMAGVLVLSSQRRIIGANTVIWFCDQSAVENFVRNDPPEKMRLKRWWVFLNQLPLCVNLRILHARVEK